MNLPPEPHDAALLARMQRQRGRRVMADTDLYDLLRYQDFGGTPRRPRGRRAVDRAARCPTAGCDHDAGVPRHPQRAGRAVLAARAAGRADLRGVARPTPASRRSRRSWACSCTRCRSTRKGRWANRSSTPARRSSPRRCTATRRCNNPTTATISRARREALADIALRYAIPIIEDDAYAPAAAPDAAAARHDGARARPTTSPVSRRRWARACATPTSALAQRAAVAAPGRRPARDHRDGLAHHQRAGDAAGCDDGTADAMLQAIRAESMARQALAARHLGGRGVAAPSPRASTCGCRCRRPGARWSSRRTCARRTWAWSRARPSRPTATRPRRCASAWAGR